jgi:iron(III) transport system ATP-binding protein
VSETVIDLRGVSKAYAPGEFAVRDLTLQLPRGSLTALLGESGCGKTTTLRLIAGLEEPDTGEIWLAGRKVFGGGVVVPPESRGIGMVFQDYALFPHLTVHDNVAFAIDRIPRGAREARVEDMLALTGLDRFGRRFPHELSGGQQQRVALARALAPRPDLVLLDEPFSNLDAALRRTMREDLRQILQDAGVTSLFVTHDQEEALSLADTVAVLRKGLLIQTGSPHEVYLRPATREIARFVGEANFLAGDASGETAITAIGSARLLSRATGPVDVMVRPEGLRLIPAADGPGTIERIHYYGHDQLAHIRLPDGTPLQIRMRPQPGVAVGARVRIEFRTAGLPFARGHAEN